MKHRVWVADKLAEEGIAALRASDALEVTVDVGRSVEEQVEMAGAFDAIIVRSSTKLRGDVLDAAKDLKIAVRAGIGVDNIDLDACRERGVVVENTPQGNARSAAEHAIALLFSLARHVPQAHRSMTSGKWEKSRFMGVELGGKTLGVLGAGNIGAIAGQIAKGIGMTIVACDPMLSDERADELGFEKVDLDTLLERADAITVHLPLIDSTRGLLSADAFRKMKSTALLVNAARGGIVDEGALNAALNEGQIGGAALDVFATEPLGQDSPLTQNDKIVLTPHLGASTRDAQVRVAVQAAEQIIAFFERGEKIHALVG